MTRKEREGQRELDRKSYAAMVRSHNRSGARALKERRRELSRARELKRMREGTVCPRNTMDGVCGLSRSQREVRSSCRRDCVGVVPG